jgi:hypothetical protein
MNNKQEIWKDIKGYEGLYKISSLGRVYSHVTYRYLKYGINKKTGYPAVCLFKNGKYATKKLHRLIAEAFIPNPLNLKEVDHIDRNKKNFNINNLRWVTHSQNMLNSNAGKWFKKGEPRPETGKPVMCIETGIIYESAQEAQRQTQISASSINNACNNFAGGYHWKRIDKKNMLKP